VIEGEKSDEARKKVQRAAGKSLRSKKPKDATQELVGEKVDEADDDGHPEAKKTATEGE
jgi:hypothetical protein